MSLTAPALAVAHGLAHDHLAHEHAAATVADHAADADHEEQGGPGALSPAPVSHQDDAGGDRLMLAVTPADHEHQHGHATVTVAPGARDLARLDLPAAPAIAPEPPTAPTALVVVRSAALTDRALLARPAPESGPPPRLRAPPVR